MAQALHDPLTGVPNRTLFLDRLEHALDRTRRPPARFALLFCDVDGFKAINDRFGHEVGDQILVTVARRLCDALRPADTVGRLGGDEFVILCEDLESEADAIRIAERVVDVLATPVERGGREHALSASVGVSFVAAPSDAKGSEVLREADAAMYRAKARGGARFELFDAPMRRRLAERLQVEEELGRGIAESELELLYQPVVSLPGGEIVAAEALVRWRHPERGVLPPAEFIEVAQESGLVVPLGEWVIGTVCHHGSELFGELPVPPSLSINLSLRELVRSPIADTLGRALINAGLDARTIELEVTERALLEERDAAIAALLRLKGMGAKLVLDDFGVGHVSLRDLQRSPIDAVKIDRSLTADLGRDGERAGLAEALLGAARALGLEAIAEGVETAAQLAWLRDHGCRRAQGYLLSPPVPPDALAALIERGSQAIPQAAAA